MFKQDNPNHLDTFITAIITNGINSTYENILLGIIDLPLSYPSPHLKPRSLPNEPAFLKQMKFQYKMNILNCQRQLILSNITKTDSKLTNLKLLYKHKNKLLPFNLRQHPQIHLSKLPKIKMSSQLKLKNEELETKLLNNAKSFITKLKLAKQQQHEQKEKERKLNWFKQKENELNNMERLLVELHNEYLSSSNDKENKDNNKHVNSNNSYLYYKHLPMYKSIPVINKFHVYRNYNSGLLNSKCVRSNSEFTIQHVKPLNHSGKNASCSNVMKGGNRSMLPKINNNKKYKQSVSSPALDKGGDSFCNKVTGNVDESCVSGKSLFDVSSVRRSPYYFNDPKYSRFNNSSNSNNNSKNEESIVLNEI